MPIIVLKVAGAKQHTQQNSNPHHSTAAQDNTTLAALNSAA